MDIFETPKQQPLSLFMTPPDSGSRPLSNSTSPFNGRLKLAPSSLLSPAATPESSDFVEAMEIDAPEEHRQDIVSDLYLGGYPLIARQILSHLSPADLANGLLVCRTWNRQISSNAVLIESVVSHRRRCKEDAENLHKSLAVKKTVPSSQRKALATVNHNTLTFSEPLSPPSPPRLLPQGVAGRRRMCPNCQSPSRQFDPSRAVCNRCDFDFCIHCLRNSHSGQCSKRSLDKSQCSTAIVGTKKSKKRLRRL